MKSIKKLAALFLCIAVTATALTGIPFGALSAGTDNRVSKLVTNDYGTYVEHNGKPYLMYGVQMRADWQYADKKLEDKTTDWDWIEENFQKVAADGFKTVAIPVYWSFVETGNDGGKTTDYLAKMYDYIYEYNLNVQWLWFGSNVCGQGKGTMPYYIIENLTGNFNNSFIKNIEWNVSDTNNPTYTPTDVDSAYVNFSDEATMQAEQNALKKMMDYIAKRDTEKRCVMIQINNEIDQGGDYWLPKGANGEPLETWYGNQEGHYKYCYAFGQKDALFTQLNQLGRVVRESGYNCITRINLTDVDRTTAWGQADFEELYNLEYIDIIGIDCYDIELNDISANLNKVEGNLTHLAESASAYDSSTNTAKLMESGVGNLIYCHRTDRTGGGMYVPSKDTETGAYNRQYKDWVERETTPAIRKFNNTINKAYEKIANAVSEDNFVTFTADEEQKTVGSVSFTLNDSSDGDKLAMALKAGVSEYVLMSAKNDCSIAVTGDDIISAEVGCYDVNGEWVKESDAVVTENAVSVNAGDAVLVKVANIMALTLLCIVRRMKNQQSERLQKLPVKGGKRIQAEK